MAQHSKPTLDRIRERVEKARKKAGLERKRDHEFDDVTDALQEVAREMRRQQPSVPEIHVHAGPPPDTTPIELKAVWKHRALFLKVLPYVLTLGVGALGKKLLTLIGILN